MSEQKHKSLYEKKKTDILKGVAKPDYPVLAFWSCYKGNFRIGFLEISATKNDIFIEPYISKYKNTRFFSYKKHQIEYVQMIGNHFPTCTCKTNLDVFYKIKETISIVMKSFPDCFLDIDIFNNIGRFVDYLALQKHVQ